MVKIGIWNMLRMTKSYKYIHCLGTLVIGIIMIGCHRQNEKFKIGFLADDFNSARWKKDTLYFAQKVRILGHIPLIRFCDSDTALQHRQAKELIEAGAKCLVIVSAHSQASARIVNTAHQAGVKVIAYDRLILNSQPDYYVSFDTEAIGAMQARYLLKKLNDRGTIAVINGPKGDYNSQLLHKGQFSVMQPLINNGKVKIVYDKYISEWTSMEASMEMVDFLGSYEDSIHGILAANDALADGAIEALNAVRDNERLIVTGQDASPLAVKNIMEGNQSMTVYKSLDQLASSAAELACQLAQNQTPNSDNKQTINNGSFNIPFLKLDPVLIDASNLEVKLLKSGHFSDAELSEIKGK